MTNSLIDTSATSGLDQSRLPRWLKALGRDFGTALKEFDEVLTLSVNGITLFVSAGFLIDVSTAVAKIKLDEATKEENKKSARAIEEIAQREVDRGFPFLYSQAVVFLWTSLEAFIRHLMAIWVMDEPTARQNPQIQKLRISFGEYDSLDEEGKGFYIVGLLEQQLQSPLKRGVDRFENVLAVLGLGGELTDNVKKSLYELSEVRHAIIHRRGVSDRKLLEACPWLNLKLGEKVIIDHDKYKMYLESVVEYTNILLDRIETFLSAESSPAAIPPNDS